MSQKQSVVAVSGNLVEGGFSTNSEANYPEGTGRKPPGETAGGEGQVDKGKPGDSH